MKPTEHAIQMARRVYFETYGDFEAALQVAYDVDLTQLDSAGLSPSSPISKLELEKRTYNALSAEGITTIWKLQEMCEAEILRVPNLGRRSYQDILRAMRRYGLWR